MTINVNRNSYVDLHLHSYYSDGTNSPEEIIIEAKSKNIDVISITDHECLDACSEFKKLEEKYDIKLINGIELSAIHNGRVYHILGYGFDHNNSLLSELAKSNNEKLEELGKRLLYKMQNDYEAINMCEYANFKYNRSLGGWKTIHYLHSKGIADSLEKAIAFYREYNCDYLDAGFPNVEYVCNIIHTAKGVPVLAHPGYTIKLYENIETFKNIVKEMLPLGIEGLECFYPSHSKEVTEACLEICRKYKLTVTNGSDSHGNVKQVMDGVEYKIGINKISIGSLSIEKLIY